MSLAGVSGRRYGPVPFEANGQAVAAFVAATGDDPVRWSTAAPPGFAAAVLFAVAPAFLGEPEMASAAGAVIHTDQEFVWHGRLPIGAELSVSGEVVSVRERRGLNLASFRLHADVGGRRWLDGSAGFLVAESAGSAEEEPEPWHDARAVDRFPAPIPLPAPGEQLPEVLRSASRGDLLRYAAATGDWNPIHWDHGAARRAGLPGVVCHGLLMAAWIAQTAARHVEGDRPLASLHLRFRRPLRPSAQARIGGMVGEDGSLRLSLFAGDEAAITATARVTA